MFDFDIGSIRWGALAVTACVMAAILLIHFLVLRPLERNAKEELKRMKSRRESLDLLGEVSALTAECLLASRQSSTSFSTAVVSQRIAAFAQRVDRHPQLQLLVRNLGLAMSDLGEKLQRGSSGEKDKAKLAIANICSAIELELGTLQRVGDT